MASLGVVAFAAPCSGEMREIDLHGSSWLCARDSFMLATLDVNVSIGLTYSIESGYFAEHGYILYRLSGHGEAFIHCGGNVIEYDLAPGQRVSVDAGCVAAFQESVTPTIEAFDGLPSSQGGSESLFLVTLTGPGKIYLATLPLSRIAGAVKGARQPAPPMRSAGRSSLGNLVKEL